MGIRTAHAFAHARLAGVSREPVLGECTFTTLLMAELSGSWHMHKRHAIWDLIEEQESPCSSQSFGCHDEMWYHLQNPCTKMQLEVRMKRLKSTAVGERLISTAPRLK